MRLNSLILNIKSRLTARITQRVAVLVASAILATFVYILDDMVVGGHPSEIKNLVAIQNVKLDTSRIWSRGPTGNSAENATNHFKKHGHQFGFRTEQEYVAAAVQFTTEPLAEGVLKNIQKDGDTAFYNPKTAEYAVKSKRGFIRTYFKLNPKIHGYASNTDYFNAQAKIGGQPPANDNSP
jgi:hypothetical protein